jgi:cytochrome b subunit of formate dehydrogenase
MLKNEVKVNFITEYLVSFDMSILEKYLTWIVSFVCVIVFVDVKILISEYFNSIKQIILLIKNILIKKLFKIQLGLQNSFHIILFIKRDNFI